MLIGSEPSAERAIDLLSTLVSIASVNPRDADPSPGTGEDALSVFLEDWATRRGLRVEVQEVAPHRRNVLMTVEGKNPARRLLWETHMDTVEAEGMMVAPFAPTVTDGRLYGRGACDAKASLASMMLAVESITTMPVRPEATIILAAVVDEEHTHRGVKALIDSGFGAEAAIVGEPTDMDVVIANRGCVRFHVVTSGRTAHSSRAHEGANAIVMMARVILALDSLGDSYRHRVHPLVGPPLLTVSVIRGGQAVNIVPDRCVIDVDRRMIPGEDAPEVMVEIISALEDLNVGYPDVDVEVEGPYSMYPPMEVASSERVVSCLTAACSTCRQHSQIRGASFGTDASFLTALAQIPAVVFGPGSIAQAHTENEWIDIAQVCTAARILQETAYRF